jgi:hypothetical protein
MSGMLSMDNSPKGRLSIKNIFMGALTGGIAVPLKEVCDLLKN